ncbi:MAG: biotin attachment protein [Gammaproteobacteria bacterium]|nr:biotin attachment protein [Gammaproteobacteria bacterium]
MIFAPTPKNIRVILTAFCGDAHGSPFRVNDWLPAMQAAAMMGVHHFEFGGARYQTACFQAGEDPFLGMDRMREAVGPEIDLQVLTRSICGVTLHPQRLTMLEKQARLLKKHGATVARNIDFMNDISNLSKTGKPIVDAGMHHQVCVAMMGLPYSTQSTHTPESYVQVVQKLLESGLHFDSVCMQDASGTTSPHNCYETAKGIKRILPPEIPLSMHTCDTASMAVACYMAGIAGGVDSIDLSVRPLAAGVMQPDVRSMARALQSTGYSLDMDMRNMDELEKLLDAGLQDSALDPVTTAPDARVVNFPISGDAIGPHLQSMVKAGLMQRYHEVLAEGPEVMRAGGVWTSAAPGSQHYWSQAVNNVLHGRWQRIDAGYGHSILGYLGRPPQASNPEVVKIAAEQLELNPCAGDPLEQAPDHLAAAEAMLREQGLPLTDENLFLVASSIAPGENEQLNAGMRWLTGHFETGPSLDAQESADSETLLVPAPAILEDPTPETTTPPDSTPVLPAPSAEPEPASMAIASFFTAPVTTQCTVIEGDVMRIFRVTIEPPK